MLRSVAIEQARQSYHREPREGTEETPPEGPCFAKRDDRTGEPLFSAWRRVDGEWTSCEAYADELTPDEVASLPAGDRSVALTWRDRIDAIGDAHDPEGCVHNVEPAAAE